MYLRYSLQFSDHFEQRILFRFPDNHYQSGEVRSFVLGSYRDPQQIQGNPLIISRGENSSDTERQTQQRPRSYPIPRSHHSIPSIRRQVRDFYDLDKEGRRHRIYIRWATRDISFLGREAHLLPRFEDPSSKTCTAELVLRMPTTG